MNDPMPSGPRLVRWATLALVLSLAAPTAARAQDAPSLRLVVSDAHIRASAEELAEVMDLGVWVASTGGAFELRLQRPGYGPWRALQADAQSGAALRPVPERLVDETGALRDFASIRFFDRRGRVAARRTVSFCPGGYERIAPDGPAAPTYLPLCGSSFPFARGAGWGIDHGWASPLLSGFAGPDFEEFEDFEEFREGLGASAASHQGRRRQLPRLRPGMYRVVARVAAPHRRLFGIPAAGAQATLRLRVTRASRRRAQERGHEASAGRSGASRRPLSAPDVDRPDPATLPDLVALPPWAVDVQRRGRRDLLHFAGSPWNAGPGRLVVEGYRRRGAEVMEAFQYFLDGSGEVTGRAPAGAMEFHDQGGHHHWHFLQFVGYRLLRPSGRTVVRARKQAFCLASTDLIDPWVAGAERIPPALGLSDSACGGPRSIWIRQQLPAGWGDTYGPDIAGQQFDITAVPNGRYLLEMHVNPRGELHEATTENNIERRTVVLGGRRGARSVRTLPWHGIGN